MRESGAVTHIVHLAIDLDTVAAEDAQLFRLILAKVLATRLKGILMASVADLKTALDGLATKVASETDVENSVVTLLGGLTALIADLKTQLANAGVPQSIIDQVTALGATVDGATAQLSAAVTANTP